MSLTVPDSFFVSPAVNARRRLHRRSSCSSIPRSVSACSSVWDFDRSSEDLRIPATRGEVETYMAPLLRGLQGFREAPDEAAEQVSASHPNGFDSRTKSPACDDSLSENLSNYHFDISGDDHNSPERPNPSNNNVTREHSPPSSHFDPPVIRKSQVDRPVRRHVLPSQTPPRPGLRPLLLVETIRQNPPSTGTLPLQVDRSKKRQESGSSPQRTPPADPPSVRSPARPIHRAVTQVNLREAYKRASPHLDKTGQTRINPIARALPLCPLPEITQKEVLAQTSTALYRVLNSLGTTGSPYYHTISD